MDHTQQVIQNLGVEIANGEPLVYDLADDLSVVSKKVLKSED